jgi:peptide/nickel transport system substrate-binding protein
VTRGPGDVPERGGTLQVGLATGGDAFTPLLVGPPATELLDPHLDYGINDSGEILRCCLARTLLTHNGRSTEEGGATLYPDLARSLPDISSDGKTWTFRLRKGVRYGPPLEHVEITAQDFVRSFHRALSPAIESPFAAFIFPDIAGADRYAAGKAASISGLETPDKHTLVIHLTRPAGDFGARLAVPMATPLPPHPELPGASFGIAEGHDEGYGPFLVSSGPYMLEGADELDFSDNPPSQEPVSGLVPGRSITLVRNPAYLEGSDPHGLRPARPDRIEIEIGRSVDDAIAAVLDGDAHIAWHPSAVPMFTPRQIRTARSAPGRAKVFYGEADSVRGIALNVAVPPFDDVHVRRALNLAVDKERMLELAGGPTAVSPAGHMVPNSLENNLLLDYDPYGTSDDRGDLVAARAEMARSRYDLDGDGTCDVRACRDVRAIVRSGHEKVGDKVRSDLAEIGIELALEAGYTDAFDDWTDPNQHVPMFVGIGWVKIQISAASFFVDQFYGPFAIGDGFGNGTLIGATPEQLERWGYATKRVPNVDARIDSCVPLVGTAQFECWAELDQYLMQRVVPWVPYAYDKVAVVASADVSGFAFDQLVSAPSLGHLTVNQRSGSP